MLVIGAILSSFLLGLHMPLLHEVMEHGESLRWDVLTIMPVLTAIAVVCGWKLLRRKGVIDQPRR
jgi:hypothetical protein